MINRVAKSKAGSLKGYLLAGLAVVTCPCHVVIAIWLLSGTMAGAFLSEHLVVASLLLLLVFILSTTGALRILGQGSIPEASDPKSRSGTRSSVTYKEENKCLD